MRKKEIFEYFAFGFNYGLLKLNGTLGRSATEAAEDIEEFVNKLDELELQVTKKIAEELLDIAKKIRTTGSVVGAEQAKEIKAITEKLDPSLDAELQIKAAYILVKKRYPLETLLETPLSLLATNAQGTLTANSNLDFRLACRQIALSQATSAAFHLMRALEEQVKCLYFAFKKINRLKKPMWHPMLQELRKKRNPKPSEKLLNHLDGMRIHFRNPTQHPDVFYKIDEAQDLLNQTISAINMIAAELPKPKTKKVDEFI